jgi:hypothetical protein
MRVVGYFECGFRSVCWPSTGVAREPSPMPAGSLEEPARPAMPLVKLEPALVDAIVEVATAGSAAGCIREIGSSSEPRNHLLPPVLPAKKFLSAAFVGLHAKYLKKLVGGDGLEPPTSCV